jgi:hypothetical protein
MSNLWISAARRRLPLAEVPARRVTVAVIAGSIVLAVAAVAVAVTMALADDSSPALTLYGGPRTVSDTPATFWRSVDETRVSASEIDGPGGGGGLVVEAGGVRQSFTLLQHDFPRAQNWAGRKVAYLEFRGSATGQTYTFIAYGDAARTRFAWWNVIDTTDGWTVVPIQLENPDRATRGSVLGHVLSVRIASVTKDSNASFALGRLTLSAPSKR